MEVNFKQTNGILLSTLIDFPTWLHYAKQFTMFSEWILLNQTCKHELDGMGLREMQA